MPINASTKICKESNSRKTPKYNNEIESENSAAL